MLFSFSCFYSNSSQCHLFPMMPCKLGKKSLIVILCVTAIGVFCRSSWNTSLHFLRAGGELWSCGCQTCLQEGDAWLRELIVASPQPFLSRVYTPPAEAYNWWKRLQNEARPLSFFNTTVHNLFEIIPPVPDVAAPRPDRCRSCAVVGNSGNLRGSHYGPLIDFHDIVIRMNHGRTKGYEADVGSKTTHHVMYPESAMNLDNTTHLIFFPFKMKDLLWLLNSFPPGENNVKRRANKDLVMILNPAFMKYVHEMWLKRKGRYPSTGFLTVALSMHMCDMVNVFGFGADSDGNWNHYFEVLRNKRLRTGPHAGTHEYDFIQKLHQQEKIQFYQGW